MVQRLILLTAMLELFVSPAYSTEPNSDPIVSNDRGSVEELNFDAPEAESGSREFARNGQFRGGFFRSGPSQGGRFRDQGTARRFGGFNWRRQNDEYHTDQGFVFIDSSSIDAPFRVERKDGELLLNEISLDVSSGETESDESIVTASVSADGLYEHLDSDRVAIKLSGREVVCLDDATGDKILSILARDRIDRHTELADALELLPPNANQNEWSNWLLDFETSDSLQQKIRERENRLAETEAQTTRLLNAEQAMEEYSYPLTILGMIVVVLAVGYLLAFNPSMTHLLPEQMRAAQLSKSVQYSVILIVVMSGLDLAWTLLSSSVGLMKELNPVGSNLISDPDSLVKFKLAATLLAAGVFLAMRKFRSAQLASWWMCIVCTLVSARWLVFNSMYMG